MDFTSHMRHTAENPILVNVQILFKCKLRQTKYTFVFLHVCLNLSLKANSIPNLGLDSAGQLINNLIV